MSASTAEQIAQFHRQSEEAMQRDDLNTAQALAEQAVRLARDELGEEDLLYANALFVQASVARIRGDLPHANQLYERAIAIVEKLPGHASDLLHSLIVLSQRYIEQGNGERAAQLRQRARQVLLERLPLDQDPTLSLAIALEEAAIEAGQEEEALSIDRRLAQAAAQANHPGAALLFWARLASRYVNLSRLEEAHQAARQAQEWRAQLDQPALRKLPGPLLELGHVFLGLDDADQATGLFQQVEDFPAEDQPADRARRIQSALGLARAAQLRRDFAQAESHYQEALTRSAHLYGGNDLHTAWAAAQAADFYLDREEYPQANEYYRFVLQVRQARLGADHLEVAQTLNDLGICADQTGQYALAEKYYRRALAIREQRLPPAHPDTVTVVYNLAELARIQGDNRTAERRFREALVIPGIPTYLLAILKNNLGELYVNEDRFDEARPLLNEALALRSQAYGAQSGQAARSLGSLGNLELAEGHTQAARDYFEKARNIFTQEGMRHFANSAAGNIAKAMGFGGDVPAAIPILEAAAEEARAIYGENHIQVASTLVQLALFYAVEAQWAKAREAIQTAVQIQDDNLVEVLLTASRSHAAAFLAETRKTLSLYLGTLLDDPQATPADRRAGYQLILRRKGAEGRLLRMLKPGRILPPWKAAQYSQRIEELAGLREQLTHCQLTGDAPDEAAALQDQIAAVEKALAEAGLERSVATLVYPLPDHAVAIALPEKSVLVEFVYLPDYAAGLREQRHPPGRYAAFILKAFGQREENMIADVDALETVFAMQPAEGSPAPALVDLGEAAQINAGVAELLRAVSFGDDGQGTPRWKRKARYLYSRLIQPLEGELADATHLVLAPDSLLNAFPFEILADPHGQLIHDRFSTSYVQVGREVIRFWEHFNPGDPALVIAAPDFDLATAATSPGEESQTEMDERLAALQAAPRFADLAYTLAEGQAVAAALQVPLHSGAAAVETLLKQGHSPEIIHIATHGFYLRQEQPQQGGAQDILTARAALDDSLERSGLALAGANAFLDTLTPPSRAQDGILFASEIVDLDLSHTDLVCLSACQSGQGEIRLGEGLKGLRSAFSAAGCHSLVCALWQIPDQISQQIIERFYAELLQGVPRAAALRTARQAFQKIYPRDPLLWAGLVLDGAPAPLYRFQPTSTLKVGTLNFREWQQGPPKSDKKPETPAEIAEDFYQQGLDFLEAGQNEAAFQALEAAIQQAGAPSQTVCRARYQRAGLLRDERRYPEALAEYDLLLATPNLPQELHFGALADRGACHILAGQLAVALQDFDAALAIADLSSADRAWLLVNRGYAYRQSEQIDAALADFSAVLALEDAPPEQQFKALLNRGDTYRQMEAYPQAVADLSQALAMPEQDAAAEKRGVRLSRGLAYYRQADYPRAIQDFNLLLQDEQLSNEYREFCLSFRARSYQASGQPGPARADYQALLALPGVSAETRAEAQAALGDPP